MRNQSPSEAPSLGKWTSVPWVDGHVDLPYALAQKGAAPFSMDQAREAGIRVFVTALYCADAFNGPSAQDHFQSVLDLALRHPQAAPLIRDANGWEECLWGEAGPGAVLLLENADILADGIEIGWLKELGIRLVGLTHTGSNRLADGNAVPFSRGLTPEGSRAAQALHRGGLLLDVAHLHPVCFWELLDRVEGPLVSTHTGIRDILDTPRNLGLDQVDRMVERGGMVGISMNPEMLTGKRLASLSDVFRHLDTAVQRVGARGVGIGSDFGGFEGVTQGVEHMAKIGALSEEMLRHGYPQGAVDAVMGLNWVRVLGRLFG